jgi:MinD-like ATPase involved in chromosome partitioning or flagellar assembly
VVSRVRLLGTSRWRPPIGQRRAPRLIAVGSANAGDGKSVVASNLAVAIAGLGPQVVLVDLDLGTPHLHELFGITRPVPGLQAWLDRELATLDGSLTSTGIRNLHLVSGMRRPAGQGITPALREELLRQLHQLDGDVVIVDIGATNREDLLDFFSLGALRLIVSGPDRPALESAFAFLKGATLRAAERYGDGAREALARFRGRIVGNRTQAPEDAESFHAFSRLVREHLALSLPVLGCLRGSDRILQSVAARRPLLTRRGLDENVRAFHQMAELLVLEDASSDDACDLGHQGPLTVAEAPLPADLGDYRRKHTRYPVDWAARLVLEDRATEVRVLDVSEAGAAVEVFSGLRTGDQAVLCFTQLPGQPALPVLVRNVLPGIRRVGMSFVERSEVSARLVAAARALTSAARGRRDDLRRA